MRNTGMITPASGQAATSDIENNLNTINFGGQVLGSMTDPRFLNVLCENPTGNLIDISGKGHDGTPGGSWVSTDRIKKGRGWMLSPDGSTTYHSLGDSDDFSFGNGTTDSPFTVFGVVQRLGVATETIIGKADVNSSTREWYIQSYGTNNLACVLYNSSAAAYIRAYTVGFNFNYPIFFTVTYDGSSLSTGIKLYAQGLEVAATRSGAYNAMENTSVPVTINAITNGAGISNLSPYDYGFMGIDAVEWSASDIWQLWQIVLAQYSENGIDLT